MRMTRRCASHHQCADSINMINPQPLAYGSTHRDTVGMCAGYMESIQNTDSILCKNTGGITRTLRFIALSRPPLIIHDHSIVFRKMVANQIPNGMVAVSPPNKQ